MWSQLSPAERTNAQLYLSTAADGLVHKEFSLSKNKSR